MPTGLATSRAAPVADMLRKVQSITAPPNSIIPALKTRGRSFGTGSPQHIDLLPQDQNFCLARYSRPQQVHHHSKDQSAQIHSRSTGSRIEFATGTGPERLSKLW
jgi:hypothetical protein